MFKAVLSGSTSDENSSSGAAEGDGEALCIFLSRFWGRGGEAADGLRPSCNDNHSITVTPGTYQYAQIQLAVVLAPAIRLQCLALKAFQPEVLPDWTPGFKLLDSMSFWSLRDVGHKEDFDCPELLGRRIQSRKAEVCMHYLNKGCCLMRASRRWALLAQEASDVHLGCQASMQVIIDNHILLQQAGILLQEREVLGPE